MEKFWYCAAIEEKGENGNTGNAIFRVYVTIVDFFNVLFRLESFLCEITYGDENSVCGENIAFVLWPLFRKEFPDILVEKFRVNKPQTCENIEKVIWILKPKFRGETHRQKYDWDSLVYDTNDRN